MVGDLLPPALAVALSPIPIVAIVLVLASPHARTAGPAFAGGWIAGLLAVSLVVVGVLGAGGGDDDGVGWLKVGIGILFLVMAVQQWGKRPKPGEPPKMPGWMASIGDVTPARAAGLGIALSAANPKNLALTLAAAASIAEAGLGRSDTALAVAVFVGLGSSTVVGAVLFSLAVPSRAAVPLASVRRVMSDHNAVIMAVVLLLIGAKLLVDGLSGVGG